MKPTTHLTQISVLTSSLILGGNVALAQNEVEDLIFIPRELPSTDDRSGDGENPGNLPSASENNNCASISERIKALVPVTIEESDFSPSSTERILEATLEETPSFWFYVPSGDSLTAQFTLVNERNIREYRSNFPLPDDGGIVGVTIPSSLPDEDEDLLKIGQDYRWQFSIICDPDRPSLNLTVQGWVRRLDTSEISSDSRERINVNSDYSALRPYIVNLVEEGIWYDALTLVGANYYENPADEEIASDWQTLLESVDLESYAEIPIVLFFSPEVE